MEHVIGFGEVAVAIFASFAVALTLEWIGLVALMRMMPARGAQSPTAELAKQSAHRNGAELSLVPRERKNAA
jgi:hypothetical protein